MSSDPRTQPSKATRAEEAQDALVESGPDEVEGPEAEVIEQAPPDEVAAHYEEMAERGADQRGEGRLP